MAFTHVIARTYRDRSGLSITSTESISADAELNMDLSVAAAAALMEIDYSVTRANMKSLSLYCLQALSVYPEKATGLTVDGTTNASGGDAVISFSGSHGLAVNDRIRVANIGGSTNLNGTWYVKEVVDADDIKISATVGGATVQGNDAAYTSGGTANLQTDVSLVAGQNRLWSLSQDGLAACPFPWDIGQIFVTNPDSVNAVTFSIRTLIDQTP